MTAWSVNMRAIITVSWFHTHWAWCFHLLPFVSFLWRISLSEVMMKSHDSGVSWSFFSIVLCDHCACVSIIFIVYIHNVDAPVEHAYRNGLIETRAAQYGCRRQFAYAGHTLQDGQQLLGKWTCIILQQTTEAVVLGELMLGFLFFYDFVQL